MGELRDTTYVEKSHLGMGACLICFWALSLGKNVLLYHTQARKGLCIIYIIKKKQFLYYMLHRNSDCSMTQNCT